MMRRVVRMVTVGVLVLAGLILAAGIGWYWVTHNVEQPRYQVLEADGDLELRRYEAMIVAEVATQGDRREGVRQGFRALAAYIFARDRSGDSIAMTAPVIQQPSSDPERWSVRFVMPSEYALADLPAPASPRVDLQAWPAVRVAAMRFGGVATDQRFADAEARLRDWMAARDLTPEGGVLYAYYDDPWTPGFLRRNEVLLRVR